MPTEPHTPTLFELVRRATEIVDPTGSEPAVTEFLERFEDRDEPVTTVPDIGQAIEEVREGLDPAPTEAAVTVAAAVATYLAYRRDEVDEDRTTLLRLAARAELDDERDPSVTDWLAHQGVAV